MKVKKTISTPLMIENPVKRPKVPPIRPRAASVVTFNNLIDIVKHEQEAQMYLV